MNKIADNNALQELLNRFVEADSVESIRAEFDSISRRFNIDPLKVFESGEYNLNGIALKTRLIYKILQKQTSYWRAKELWVQYDDRANLDVYKNNSNKSLNVLIIGAGPVGLMLSIECALLGHKCTIIEKRDRLIINVEPKYGIL